jgi:hypothetical protein
MTAEVSDIGPRNGYKNLRFENMFLPLNIPLHSPYIGAG